MRRTCSILSCAAVAALLAGCPGEGDNLDPGTSPDGGVRGDAGAPDASGPVFTVTRFGRYTPGATRAVLTSPDLVVLGHELAYIEPADYGLRGAEAASPYRGGLVTLDPHTGVTRLYTEADGLPQAVLDEPAAAPAPIYDLDWLTPGEALVAAAWTHLVRGARGADGAFAFGAVQLTGPGAANPALISTAVALSDEVIVGTDQGFCAVSRDDLTLRRWLPAAGYPWTRALIRLDPATALATAGPADTGEASDVFVLAAGASEASRVAGPGVGYVPVALGVLKGQGLVSYRRPDGRGELRKVVPAAAGGYETELYVDADALAGASDVPFVAGAITYDPTHRRLVLGGAITVLGPVRTGGLAVVLLDHDGELQQPVEVAPLVDRRDPYTQLFPWQVGLLEVDDAGRLYVAGVFLCNEHRAGLTGLYRLEQDDDGLRMVRPIPTGVRGITAGPDGAWWLSLWDEAAGLRCFGQEVQQGACRLRADGACELYTPNPNTDDGILANAAPAQITFGADPAERKMAFATYREATYVRSGDVAQVIQTQFEPGLKLDMTAAAWGEGDALWLGSTFGWDSLPGFPEEDVILINRRVPQGLGYVEVDPASGRVSNLRRYVRAASDQQGAHEEIAGLPSSNVQAVLPLAGGAALVGMGPERVEGVLGHRWPEWAPTGARGGIAWVKGSTVAEIASASPVDLTEVVAFARSAAGELLALDATFGVFEVDVDARTATQLLSAAWTQEERGLSFAVSPAGAVAVGTTRGLYLQDAAGALVQVDLPVRTGFVSALRFEAEGVLLAGGDEGLLRVVWDGVTPPALGPTGLLAREPWPLPPGCDGERGCACASPDACAPGLSCLCDAPSACSCQAPLDPCERDPGTAGCACDPAGAACARGFVCQCEGEACACQPEPDACVMDCTCSTPSGCPDGMHCEGGIVGFSCVPD
jgi:hypothetical protein